jgi:toxin HigB-1
MLFRVSTVLLETHGNQRPFALGFIPAKSHKSPAIKAAAAERIESTASRLLLLSRKPPHRLTSVRLQATVTLVRIRSFVHKGVKKLYADDVTKGVPPDSVDKLRKMLAFLDDMEEPEELRALPSWKVHTLSGSRKGTWSLSVTANRRLTFRIDTDEGEIYDVNLEDYH